MVNHKITETVVNNTWQSIACAGVELITVDEQRVHILYPGRPSDEPGSDIKDAVLKINGKNIKGDIEIHVHSSDWFKHAHHQDKAYNGNILHVVMFHDSENLTGLENGGCIPIVSLINPSLATARKTKHGFNACPASMVIGPEKILVTLNIAGGRRFEEKETQFLNELKKDEANQCLYRGIMGALGYSKNTQPFRDLAEMVPLRQLEHIFKEVPGKSTLSEVENLLLETAGFHYSHQNPLNSPQGGVHSSNLHWKLFRVRPGNHPARRLAGMARLIIQYRKEGFLTGLIGLIEKFQGGHYPEIEDNLIIEANDYWVDHYCPGKECSLSEKYLVGRSRVKEILVNILLPFAAAFAEHTGKLGLAEQALAVYSGYPAGEENNIERHMLCQLGIKRSLLKTSQAQQGLHHLYKRFCTQGKCGECMLQV
jgi:hypothetical protein